MFVALMLNTVSVEAAVIAPPKKWDGAAAGSYAIKYATSPNKNYHEFLADCTNFASQCVSAGNKYMDCDAKQKPKKGGKVVSTSEKWYYVSGGSKDNYVCTTSWCRCSGKQAFANYWYSYNVGAFAKLSNVRKNSSVGDVIQITKEDGTLQHSIIVSKKDKSEIYCASHTSNYSADKLAEIDKRATKQWGKVKYTVFHFK